MWAQHLVTLPAAEVSNDQGEVSDSQYDNAEGNEVEAADMDVLKSSLSNQVLDDVED